MGKSPKSGKPTGAGRPSGTVEQRSYYSAPTTPSGTPRTGEPSAEFKAKLEEDIKAQQEAQKQYVLAGKSVTAEEYQAATVGKEVMGIRSAPRDTRTQREKEIIELQRESQRATAQTLTPTIQNLMRSGKWETLTQEEKARLSSVAGGTIVPGVRAEGYTGRFLITEKYKEPEQLYQTIRKKSTGEITYKPYGEPVEKQHFIFGETPEAEARRIKYEEKKAQREKEKMPLWVGGKLQSEVAYERIKEKAKPYYEKVKEEIPQKLYPSYWTKKYFPEQAPFVRKGGVTILDIVPWKREPKEFLKKSEQFSIGFGEKEWKELREKPIKYSVLTGVGFVLPYAGKGIKYAGEITKISRVKGVTKLVGGVSWLGGAGLTAVYGAEKYKELREAKTPYEKGGVLGQTVLELGALGAGAYAQRRVSAWWQTRGREEIPTYRIVEERIISGKQIFPIAPVREHMKLFIKGAKKYGLPKETAKYPVWKAVPESWAKKTEILPGGYELPGVSVAPSVSTYFLRTLTGGYFGYEFPIAKSPAALRIYTKGFKYGRVEKVGKKFKWIQELEKGYTYLPKPWKKTEIESLIPVGTQVTEIGKKYFFKWKGIRIPIKQYEVGGIGKVPISETFGKAISKYSYYGKGEGLITPYVLGGAYLTKYQYKKPSYKYYKPSRYEPYYKKPYYERYYAETYKPSYTPYKYEPYKPYGYRPSRYKPSGYPSYYKPYKPTGVTPYYYKEPRQPIVPPPIIPGLLLTPSGIGKRKKARGEKYFITTMPSFSAIMRGVYGKQLPRGKLWSSLEERRVPEWLKPKMI